MSTTINWTEENKDKVLKLIENYEAKNEKNTPESVYQSDRGQIGAISLVGDIIDVLEKEISITD
jgi:hypothetical protein